MIKFRIDLGNGDFIDLDAKSGTSLSDMLEIVRNANDWVVLGETAIQKSHIKRIEKISR
jgi:hypothetical protein